MPTQSSQVPFGNTSPGEAGQLVITPPSRQLFLLWYDLNEGFESLIRPWVHSKGKRGFDLLFSCMGILIASPLIALIAVVIKMTSAGPVFFCQERIGKGNRPFVIYKFRTMKYDREQRGLTVTRCADQRMTGVGRVLRKVKLDELPQLFNIIRGEMTFVGPRPKLAAHEQMDMCCRPGLTGAATLIFAQEETLLSSVSEQVCEDFTIFTLNRIKAEIDLKYAQRSTFASDMGIIVSTVFTFGNNAAVQTLSELDERFDLNATAELAALLKGHEADQRAA